MAKVRQGRQRTGEPSATDSRRLVIVPIVHSQSDMGSHAAAVRDAYIRKGGAEAWDRSRRAIDTFWADIEQRICALDLDLGRVRLYQDALPVCGRETEIVKDLAEAGGVNYRILRELVNRGATLEGTEDAELLCREYELLRRGNLDEEAAAEIMKMRDLFITGRIDETLKPGELGLLFVGALHRVTEHMPGTIAVLSLADVESGLRSGHGADENRVGMPPTAESS